MRDNSYIIDEHDVFQIKPLQSTDSEEEEASCPVNLISVPAESEEDWD